jgi:hypothetical protein
MFGVVSAVAFFVPGLMYHFRRMRSAGTERPPNQKSADLG